jgi:hypothetical protein
MRIAGNVRMRCLVFKHRSGGTGNFGEAVIEGEGNEGSFVYQSDKLLDHSLTRLPSFTSCMGVL